MTLLTIRLYFLAKYKIIKSIVFSSEVSLLFDENDFPRKKKVHLTPTKISALLSQFQNPHRCNSKYVYLSV